MSHPESALGDIVPGCRWGAAGAAAGRAECQLHRCLASAAATALRPSATPTAHVDTMHEVGMMYKTSLPWFIGMSVDALWGEG